MQCPAAVHFGRPRFHAAGVAAMIGFGQAETADLLAAGQPGQVLLTLFGAAISVNRIHDQGTLHAHRAAVAAVNPFDLARNQAIADIIQAGRAVFFGQGRAQHAQLAHFAEDGAVKGLVAMIAQRARHQLVLAVPARGIAHHALFIVQLIVQQKRVIPSKICHRANLMQNQMKTQSHFIAFCAILIQSRHCPGWITRDNRTNVPTRRGWPSALSTKQTWKQV